MNKIVKIILLISCSLHAQEKISTAETLSFNALEKMRFTTSSFTSTDIKRVPSSVTQITRQMIEESGARNIFDLLQIYVPSLQVNESTTWGSQLSLRGNSTGMNKVMFLVNGQSSNMHSTFRPNGGLHTSLLGDVHEVEVVRGPGSAVFGPGAITAVVNIKTYDADSFADASISVKTGFVEEFQSLEYKESFALDEEDKHLLFLYFGIDSYRGAKPEDSPIFSSYDYDPSLPAGEALTDGVGNHYGSYDNQPRFRLHLDYKYENFNTWLRYTRDGQRTYGEPPARKSGLGVGIPIDSHLYLRGFESQLFTWHVQHEKRHNDCFKTKASLTYDFFDFIHIKPDVSVRNGRDEDIWIGAREDRVTAKFLAEFTLNEDQDLAFAYELARLRFSDDILIDNEQGAFEGNPANEPRADSWWLYIHSLASEYQWRVDDNWTVLLGARVDIHDYMDRPMWAYRPALLYVGEDYELKFNFNHSERKPDESDLRFVDEQGGSLDRPEVMDQFEFIYTRQLSDNLSLETVVFYQQQDVITFNNTSKQNEHFGQLENTGLELMLNYDNSNCFFSFSHSYSHLLNFELEDSTAFTQLTAEPYGASDDMAEISPHITKIYTRYDFDDRFRAYGSLVYLWDFTGTEDLAEYNAAVVGNTNRSITNGVSRDAFQASILLNMGARYQHDEQHQLGLDLHNVLGWFDEDYNKLNQSFRNSIYRNRAPSVTLSYEYRF